MKEQKKQPELRFNGFTDDWEERNLGEVVQKVKSYSLSRDVETEDDTGFEYIHYGDIHTQKADVIDGNTKLPSIVPGDYDLIQGGDVIVADASEDYLGIAEPAVVVNKPTENLVAGLHTIAIRPNGIHPLFLYYLLHTQLFKHFGYRTGTGLKVFGISYPNLAKFTFAMPTLDEQEAIANTLRDIDNLIAANQRKLDLLKEQKKGYLQKMFPKNGAKVPELRFAGFADAWEERKLTDLATTYIGLVTTMTENYTTEGTLLIRNSDIKEGRFDLSNPIYLEEHFAEKNKTRRMKKGDVVTVHTGDIGTSAIINSELDGTIGFATITTRPKKELDSNFLAWYFNSNYHKKYAKRMSTGDGRSNYNMKDFNKNVIPTPKIAEQQKIGSFFKQLDETLALHQRKLDLLKEQKKGFLQKMFV
ncbi:MAG: restriction endonuclease subunit S [Latilactobacillus curvatus]